MFPIHVEVWETKPRRTRITEAITAENIEDFGLIEFCRVLNTDQVQAVMCRSKHGEVPASIGQHVVLAETEAYPITADELELRYRRVEE